MQYPGIARVVETDLRNLSILVRALAQLADQVLVRSRDELEVERVGLYRLEGR